MNELTRTDIFHTSGSAFRLNSSYNNILPNSFFPPSRLSADEEDSGDINGDDNIFEADDYYNYDYGYYEGYFDADGYYHENYN